MLHIFSQFRVTERKFEDVKETEEFQTADSKMVNAEAVLLMFEGVLGTDSELC